MHSTDICRLLPYTHTPQPAPGQPTPDTAWPTTRSYRYLEHARFHVSVPLPLLPQPEILTVLSPWQPLIRPLAFKGAQIAKELALLGPALAAQSTPQHTRSQPQHLHVLCVVHVDDKHLSEYE